MIIKSIKQYKDKMGCCILQLVRKNLSIKHRQYQTSSQSLNNPHYQMPKQPTPDQQMNISESYCLAYQNQLFQSQKKVTVTLDKVITKSTFNQEQQTVVHPNKENNQNKHLQVQQKLQGLIQQQSNILKLIQKATTIDTKQHFIKLKRLYLEQIALIQQLKTYCSNQSLQELKAYIYSRLTDVATSQKNHQQSSQYFHKAIEAYNRSSPASIQQRITLLNNYSVYEQSRGQVSQAKKYLKEAIDLMSEYFVVGDDRKYLAFINLGCLEYESGSKDESRKMLMKILSQCKNEEIVQLAKKNYEQYSGIDIDDLQF